MAYQMSQHNSVSLFNIQLNLYRFYLQKIQNSVHCSFISDVFVVLLLRCEMEKQILGEINGDFANRNRESHDSQVTLSLMACVVVKSKATDLIPPIKALNHLSWQVILMLLSCHRLYCNYQFVTFNCVHINI